MTHVLVTGGAGFIDTHVTHALQDAGHQVSILDVGHPAAHTAALPDTVHGAPVRFADVRDRAAVADALRGVYGPGMPRDTPYSGVAAIFRSALEAGRAPRVFEDGAQRRDFVHVRDVARANVAALNATGGNSAEVDLATGVTEFAHAELRG